MILHGSRILQGYGRSTPGPQDQSVNVKPDIQLSNPAVSPTHVNARATLVTATATVPVTDSLAITFYDTRSNQAASQKFFLGLDVGLWDIFIYAWTHADYKAPITSDVNLLLMYDKAQSVNVILVQHRPLVDTQIETTLHFSVALTEPAFFDASMCVANVGQTQEFGVTMICNRLQ